MSPHTAHRNPIPALVAVAIVIGGLGAVVLWWRSGPVDPAVVGRWQTTAEEEHGLLRTDVIDVARSGAVEVERLTRGRGRFEAAEGRWHLVTPAGNTIDGRYAMTAPGRVSFRGFPFGGESWEREVMPEGGGPLAGRWRGTSPDAPGGVTAFIVDADGRYRFARTVRRQARLAARAGEWVMQDAEGTKTVGRYHLDSEGALVVSDSVGQTTWQRR
jgi:hypothetical protein